MTLPFTDSTIARARRLVAVLAAIAALGAALVGGFAARQAEGANPKNVIFILTDDQTANEIAAMPWTQLLIANQGVTFNKAYASYPLCCPSRVSLLTSEYTHNHGVRGNGNPIGGWSAFIPHESNALPVWLHDDGYYNVHIGKYMNAYLISVPGVLPVPPGWDQWYGKTSQEDLLYFNYQVIEQTGPKDEPQLTFYGANPSDFQTDVFRDKAVEFVKDLTGDETPFMMNVWFNAPHGPFEPAPRDLFTRSTTPLSRLPGFDEKDISDKPLWLRQQAKQRMSAGLRRTIVAERRRREEQLVSVDEAVKQIVTTLASKGILDDTYLVFASDNGFFRGEHRIIGGKYLPHDPSARVPLLLRGPGIPAGGVSDEVVSLIDVPQTILDIAGEPDPALDGRSLLPYAESPALRSTRPVLIEADTGRSDLGLNPAQSSASRATARVHLAGKRGVKNLDQEPNPIKSLKSAANGNFAPAYKAIRTARYLYVLYANGQSELYDMVRDPYQLRSLSGDPRYRPVRKWLFSQLVPLSSCKGAPCRLDIGIEPLPLKGKLKPKAKGKRGKGRP
jgi:N-acetylglucosamine-6-sulfatase